MIPELRSGRQIFYLLWLGTAGVRRLLASINVFCFWRNIRSYSWALNLSGNKKSDQQDCTERAAGHENEKSLIGRIVDLSPITVGVWIAHFFPVSPRVLPGAVVGSRS